MKKSSGCFGVLAAVIITFIIAAFIYNLSRDKKKQDNMYLDSGINPVYKEPTPEQIKENKQKALAELVKELDNKLLYITKSFDNTKFDGTIDNLKREINYFNDARELIRKGDMSESEEAKQLSLKLQEKLNALQNKEFPLLRKKYQAITASNLWEHDIYVNVSGSRNTTIEFTGAIFAANKNIKDFYTEAKSVFELFRFKQVRFKWYKGASEYTYYEIETPSDKDPVFYSM